MTTPKSGMAASCPCGAQLEIDPNETTQEIACPECGMTLEVAIAIDSRTKKVRLGILVKDSSLSQRAMKGKGQEMHTAKCVCGAMITVESGGMDAVYTCSACDADYTAIIKKSRTGGPGSAAQAGSQGPRARAGAQGLQQARGARRRGHPGRTGHQGTLSSDGEV